MLLLVYVLHSRYQILNIKKVIKEIEERIATPISEIYQFDSELGWVAKPGEDYILRTYHNYDVTIGKDGWRGETKFQDADVVVLGDSFAFGLGVDEEDHFQNLSTQPRIKAIGLPGYNLVQEFLLLEKYQNSLKNKTIVWFVFYGNDFYESIQPNMMNYTTPYVKEYQGVWRIQRDHLDKNGLAYDKANHDKIYYAHLGLICSDEYERNTKMLEAMNFIFREAKDILNKQNAMLLIMGVPDVHQLNQDGVSKMKQYLQEVFPGSYLNIDPRGPDKKLNALCETLELSFVSGFDFLQAQDYAYDLHWNPVGHQKIFRQIQSYQKL